MTAALVLDCRGLRCPAPVITLARHIADVEIGQIVEVMADDPAARADIPAWCRMKGQEFAGESTAPDGTPRFAVRRVG